jgi:ABC-2 type transport system permease protein
LWYLAITEWIVFTAGARYRQVEAEIASGATESALLRPLPHGLATLARWSGNTTWYITVMAFVGVATAWTLTGHAPPHPLLAPLVVLSAALSVLLILLCQLQLGYVAVWFGVSGPVFWVWQKLLFVLGGLQFPLLLYPGLLRRIAENSPFAAMLFAPGSLVLEGGPAIASLFADQLLWLAILGALTLAVGRSVTARLVRTGG